MKKFLLSGMIAIGLASPSGAAEINGRARVVDGDTLVLDGVKIRFNGVDAPETDQVCLNDKGEQWACGVVARDRLAERIGGADVSCSTLGADRYGRSLAKCRVGQQDLQQWLVREGLALSYRQYSHDYDSEENGARQRQAGMWGGAFIAPWDWRHRSKNTEIKGAYAVPVSAQAKLLGRVASGMNPNAECAIRGNVNRKNERIYHLPGMRDYANTRMDKRTGERWFCTEDEATAAGWRKALR